MKAKNPLVIIVLILSGEMIFVLPFVLARIFRPTILTVFDINNFQLGAAFAIYGTVAMSSYFFGGIIADRFKAHNLISVALLLTGLGGLYMTQLEGAYPFNLLYGYWGLTTILLFWAAMIRATRLWGGDDAQGQAFGLLEGGRGLVAAIIGTLGVTIFSLALPDGDAVDGAHEVAFAFRRVILIASILVMLTGVYTWFALRKVETKGAATREPISLANIKAVLALPTIWLQAIIIICAYTGYKATDNFSLFASDILDYTDLEAAMVGTLSLWLRPVVAIGAGYMADRYGGLHMTGLSFVLVGLGALVFAAGVITSSTAWIFFMVMMSTSAGIYALRGLYFAIMKEGRVPVAYTGTSVGLMSVLGYTPDIFMGPTMGYLLDQSPGIVGHQHLFLVLAVFSLIGFIATKLFYRYSLR